MGYIVFIHAHVNAQFDSKEPKTYIIAELTVKGAQFSDPNAIKALSGLAVGRTVEVPGKDISDVIRRLWGEGIFSDIKVNYTNVNDNTISLEIAVTERPRISQFTFEGISKSQAEDLREKINFIRGTILTESKRQSAMRIIRNFYVEKGFYNTKVAIATEPDRVLKNGVNVNIIVDKGKKVKIDEIIVRGNEALSEKKVEKKMKKINERKFGRFWVKSRYIPKEYREAKKLLLDSYRDLGFRDALIESDTVYPSSTSDGLVIELDIYEGQKYFHRNITWVGNVKYDSETLGSVLKINSGDVYSSTKLSERLTGDPNSGDISSLYLDDGYLFFNVQPVEALVEGDSIDLEIRVQEGLQATIRKIIVEGNDKTSDYVVLREIRTQPGQKFSRQQIIRSQREILALNYFNQETLGVEPIPDQRTGTVDIKYTVEEQPSDQLQLQGGWGGRVRDPLTGQTLAGGFVGTVQLAFNNFSTKKLFDLKEWRPVPSGDGQRLSLAVQMNGVGYRNFTVSFQEPWLGGNKPNSLGVSAAYTLFQNRPIGGNSTSLFRNTIISGSIDFGTRLSWPDDFFRSVTSLGYKNFDLENPRNFFAFFDENDTEANINIITLRQSFDRTSIDAPIYPRSGSIISFSVEATPPYSLFQQGRNFDEESASEKFRLLEYHKWKFSSSWFWNVFGNFVVNAKLETGFVGSYSKRLPISPFERFALGGSGLVQGGFAGLIGLDIIPLRGYEDQSLRNNNENFPIYNRMLLEFRQPLTLNQSSPVWLLAFLEGGNGYTGFREYNPFDIRRAAGVGVRVMLPMVGLLGLDWGYGFDRATDTSESISGAQFHFIIGQQF